MLCQQTRCQPLMPCCSFNHTAEAEQHRKLLLLHSAPLVAVPLSLSCQQIQEPASYPAATLQQLLPHKKNASRRRGEANLQTDLQTRHHIGQARHTRKGNPQTAFSKWLECLAPALKLDPVGGVWGQHLLQLL